MAETDSQVIVKAFARTFNLKFNGVMFRKQLGMANGLLKFYSLEDILLCMTYLGEVPQGKQIVSLGYFPYILNETIIKAKAYYLKKTIETKVDTVEDYKPIDNTKKVVQSSMFKNNRAC